jgi:hypothetical protein
MLFSSRLCFYNCINYSLTYSCVLFFDSGMSIDQFNYYYCQYYTSSLRLNLRGDVMVGKLYFTVLFLYIYVCSSALGWQSLTTILSAIRRHQLE